MKGASFAVDLFEDIIDVVIHGRHLVQRYFCYGSTEFVVLIEVHSKWIKVIENSVWAVFVGSGGCGVVGNFCERQLCFPVVVPIVAVDVEVLL